VLALSPGGASAAGFGQVITPNANPVHISPYEGNEVPAKAPDDAPPQRSWSMGPDADEVHPRVVMQFPAKPDDMLLSGMLSGGPKLANRVLVADVPLGKGHIVLFALRPFWRWQTQGTFFLPFNAILNWNDLDAGKADAKRPRSHETQ